MARVYQAWADSRAASFHYVSASPWQLYPLLADFIRARSFPPGTFHLRPFRLKDGSFLDLFQSPERYKRQTIVPLLEKFPHRRFVLVGDSGERDPEIYGTLAREHRQQIVRILIRDVTGEPRQSPRYQSAFADLPVNLWRVFQDPASLIKALP
jgi:phosphatidate phosphatase APP1